MILLIRSSRCIFQQVRKFSSLKNRWKSLTTTGCRKLDNVNNYVCVQIVSFANNTTSTDDEKTEKTTTENEKTTAKRLKIVLKSSKTSDKTTTTSPKYYQPSKLITRLRAMTDYCLGEQDFDGLAELRRRSADAGTSTIMYYESDVEKRAVRKFGTVEALKKEQRKAKLSRKVRANLGQPPRLPLFQRIRNTYKGLMKEGPVIMYAVGVNSLNCVGKFGVAYFTGSHSLFAEGIHSLMDTFNQVVLAIGVHYSIKRPDKFHPYGYMNLRHVTSLISGVAFFCAGTGFSVYHGVNGLLYPDPLEPLFWAYVTLGFSLVTEGGTLVAAYRQVKKKAKEEEMTVWNYVRQSDDPSLNVVLLEDCASVLGVGIAFACIGASSLLNSTVPDALGSIFIGGLLAGVAGFIIKTNSDHLVGRAMPQEETDEITRQLENDPMIRSVQDVKTTELGGDQTRFKAEVDLNGYEMMKAYLKTQDVEILFEEVKSFESPVELENFLLMHGENVVYCVGAEMDRIEKELTAKHPDVTHVDLEVL